MVQFFFQGAQMLQLNHVQVVHSIACNAALSVQYLFTPPFTQPPSPTPHPPRYKTKDSGEIFQHQSTPQDISWV